MPSSEWGQPPALTSVCLAVWYGLYPSAEGCRLWWESGVSEEGSSASTHCGYWESHSLHPGLSLSICQMEMLCWPCRIAIRDGCSRSWYVLVLSLPVIHRY